MRNGFGNLHYIFVIFFSVYLQRIYIFFFTFSGNMRRREDIKRYWYFDCTCPRCSDVTEMGSFMSAVICFACQKGYLLPIHALEYKSDWICDSCQNVVPYDLVNEVITTIEEQVKTFFLSFFLCTLKLPFSK